MYFWFNTNTNLSKCFKNIYFFLFTSFYSIGKIQKKIKILH